MPRIQIRRAARRDIEAITGVEKASFGPSAWPAWLFEEYLQDCGDLFLVGIMDRHLAGYSITCFESSRAELDSIAVHPSCRGHGLAARLLIRSETVLRRRELKHGLSRCAAGIARLSLCTAVSDSSGRVRSPNTTKMARMDGA